MAKKEVLPTCKACGELAGDRPSRCYTCGNVIGDCCWNAICAYCGADTEEAP